MSSKRSSEMCGRKTLTKGKLEIIEELLVDEWDENYDFQPSYNVAPTHRHPVMFNRDGKRAVSGMYWGLIPAWSKDRKVASKLINARSETLDMKPAFRDLLSSRRCIIPADGFYEWRSEGKGKQPYYVYLEKQPLLSLAGLYTGWVLETGHTLWTYTIITRESAGSFRNIHSRMPVILDDEASSRWLDHEHVSSEDLQPLFLSSSDDLLFHPVHQWVNSVANNRPECLLPYTPVQNMSLFPD